jgi:hypothetical protein
MMASRVGGRPPTKEQIAALTELVAVTDLKDAVEKSIAHIEAQLDFSDRDEGWARGAVNALALHRYAARLLARRIAQLRSPDEPVRRPREANDALTNYALVERPTFDPAASRTIVHVDKVLQELTDLIAAIDLDRGDEIANGPGRRDEGFLAITSGILKRLRCERHELTLRRASLLKDQRQTEHSIRQVGRESAFIEAAQLVLDRETYLRVWATADRIRSESAAA